MSYRVQHYNGDATVNPARVTLTGHGFHIRIKNIDATNNLLLSFDKGQNSYILRPGEELSEPVTMLDFVVTSSAATVGYRALVAQG